MTDVLLIALIPVAVFVLGIIYLQTWALCRIAAHADRRYQEMRARELSKRFNVEIDPNSLDVTDEELRQWLS